ncbi:hypothetical protein KJ641_04140 [Patescibacteria group bacterium]|nr:hypothetical protein [Patescibacteria group bacterium]MBU1896030.1 hypothetical protein [Patescibacteria group bacterium]
MKNYLKTGIGFGITSATITTLGLMIGLYSSTGSRLAVLSGILIIAVADALSDAFGIHMSEESKGTLSKREVWLATLSTFLAKLIFASTFIIPVLIFSLPTALIVNVVWGLAMLTTLSIVMARSNKDKVLHVVAEHVILAVCVIVGSYYLGEFINKFVN